MNEFSHLYQPSTSYSLRLHYCGKQTCLPSHCFGPAKRAHYLFHFVTKGKGTYFVNNKAYKIGENEGFIIFPGESTYYEADNKHPWEYYWIGFDGIDCESILNECKLNIDNHRFIAKDPHKTVELIKNIISYAENSGDDNMSQYIQLSNLYALFATMVQKEKTKKLSEKDYLQKAIDFITKNYAYPISIADIARYVGLERSYLFRIFKHDKNMGPKEYLIHFRTEIAKSLLIQTNMPITEVAMSAGFKNISLFYKHFKAQYQLTPKKYRDLALENKRIY